MIYFCIEKYKPKSHITLGDLAIALSSLLLLAFLLSLAATFLGCGNGDELEPEMGTQQIAVQYRLASLDQCGSVWYNYPGRGEIGPDPWCDSWKINLDQNKIDADPNFVAGFRINREAWLEILVDGNIVTSDYGSSLTQY